MFCLTILFLLPALWFVVRYNLHMLQLNVYINKEHYVWLNDNIKRQWLLIAVAIVGILQIFFMNVPILVFEWLIFCLVFFIFKLTCEMNSKKAFHFTSRCKRIFATDLILSAIFVAVICFLWGEMAGTGALGVVLGLQMIVVPSANAINSPVEKAVRNFYITDAKKALKRCDNLTIIGVTGSFGKTSMKFFLNEVLSAKFNVLMTPESYNTPMGIVKTIREELTSTHEIFICEMGARYVGEIKEICDFVHPDLGIITSVGPAHLMTFGSLENIAKTKFELADALPKGGKLFVNVDSDLALKELTRRKSAGVYDNVIRYSSDGAQAEFVSEIISITSEGTDFSTSGEGLTTNLHTRLVGAHNVVNLTGAVACASSFGISRKEIASLVRKIKPVPHRMEMKKQGDVTIIDDAFNSNPQGSTAAVQTLSLFDGVRILVTPGMVELGDEEEAYNFKFGEASAPCCDWIVLVGKKHSLPIKNGALKAGFDPNRIESFDTFDEAISFAYKIDHGGTRAYILLENDLPDNYS